MKLVTMVIALLACGALPAAAQQDTVTSTSSASYSASGEEGWLGMGISCSQCSFEGPGRAFARRSQAYVTSGARRWSFREPPVVFSVEANGPADKAGLRTGDTLVSIGGYPLTSVQGGERFASVDPGQSVTLRYRRDGRETDARLTAGSRPRSAEVAYQDSLRAAARAQAQAQREAERALERQRESLQRAMQQSQSALERQREYMQQAMEQLQRTEGRFADSARQAAVLRTQRMLDSAVDRWRVAESLYAQVPAPTTPVAAAAPWTAVAPVAPWPSIAPIPTPTPYALAPVAPLSYAQHRRFGELRYTGQLGDVVIEARSPSAQTATVESDSEVVVTSRDLSVRIAIRRASAPAPKPARPPRPAAQRRPAPAPKPAPPAREPI